MPLLRARQIVFAVLFLGLSGLVVLGQPGKEKLASQASFKVVVLPKDRQAEAISLVEKGALIQIAPAEYAEIKTPNPRGAGQLKTRVISARYRAKFVAEPTGDSYLTGTAEWAVRRPAKGSAIVPLDGLHIALRQAKWSDGHDAILYKRSIDSSVFLFVPEGDERALNLDWSARGITEPGEIRYEIRVPAVPVASLELELPAGLTPVLPQAEALLSGPFPAGQGEHSWRIAFSGISRLEIHLRRASESVPPLFARVVSTQTLNGSVGTGRFEFKIESAKTGFSELLIAHDPSFIPQAVLANNLVSWTAVEANSPTPSILVRFREPTRNSSVVVTGELPLTWAPKSWKSPNVWLKDGILRQEELILSVGPSLELREWKPRGYRLVKSALAANRTYRLELEPLPTKAGSFRPPRPELILGSRDRSTGSLTQQAEWTVGQEEEQWVVKSTVTPVGKLQRPLHFALPHGWRVDRVEANGREVPWSVTGSKKRRLEIEPDLGAQKGTVTAYFKRPRAEMNRELLDMPDLFPQGGITRTGSLTIRVDPSLIARASDAVPTTPTAGEPSSSSLLVRQLGSLPLSGQLALSDRPARHRVDLQTEVRPASEGVSVASTLLVSIESGAISEIRYWTATPVPGSWNWFDDRGRWMAEAVRVPLDEAVGGLLALSPQPGLASLNGQAALSLSLGCHWKIRFARPLVRDTKLHSNFAFKSPGNRVVWPIVWPLGVPFTGVVRTANELEASERDARWSGVGGAKHAAQEFQYGGSRVSAAVNRSLSTPAEWTGARVIHTIDSQGEVRVSFRIHVRRWSGAIIHFTLPERSEDLHVQVAGREMKIEPHDSTLRTISVPMSFADSFTAIDLSYGLPARSGWLGVRFQPESPLGPFDPKLVRRFWQVSPEWRPLFASDWQTIPGSGDRRLNLPLPDWRALADLSRVVPVEWKDRQVVVDAMALSTMPVVDSADGAGVSVDSKSVIAIESPSGVLITSRAEHDRWRQEANRFAIWPDEVNRAVDQATREGRDDSGRFMTMALWEQKAAEERELGRVPSGWWIAEDDGSSAQSLLLVNSERLAAGSWLLAMIFVGVVLLVIRSARAKCISLGVLAALCCIVWFAVPSLRFDVVGPFLFVLAVGSIVELLLKRQTPIAVSRPSRVVIRAAATVSAALLVVALVHAVDTPADEILEIRGPDEKPKAYLVPLATLERLRLAKGLPPHSPAIVSASYTGSRDGSTARLRATYRLHCFADGTSRVSLPIAGARFRSVSLDGAEARDIDANSERLVVAVSGKGTHNLELEFTIPISSNSNDREIKCSIPEVPLSRLAFDIKGPSISVQTGGWRGAVSNTALPDGRRLEADLGISSSILLHWSEGAEQKASIRVKQAAVWQVGLQSATLNGLYEYRISGGDVRKVHLAIPNDTEVSRLSIRGETISPSAPSARIREWSVGPAGDKGERTLTIETQTPILSRVVFAIELIRSSPPQERLDLAFPHPLGVTECEAHAAIVLQDLGDPGKFGLHGLEVASADSFHKDIWASLDGNAYPGKILAAFRMSGLESARLAFLLRPVANPRTMNESIVWWVDPTRLIAQAESRWTGTAITTVEWTLPRDFSVLSLRADGVASWSQTAGRVRVWFDKPRDDVTISWTALQTRPSSESARVVLPAISHEDSTEGTFQNRVRTANGWVVAELDRADRKNAIAPLVCGELAWKTNRSEPIPLAVYPPQGGVTLPIQTSVKSSGTKIESVSLLDLGALSKVLPHVLSIEVADCKDCDVELTTPGRAQAFEVQVPGVDRRWDIAIPVENSGEKLAISIAPRASTRDSWPLPRVTASSGFGDDQPDLQLLSVESSTLSLHSAFGLRSLSRNEWQVVDRDWKGTVSRVAGLAKGEAGRITSGTIAVDRAGEAWNYRAEYALVSSRAGRVTITAPPDTRLFSAERNGQPIPVTGRSIEFSVDATDMILIGLHWISETANWQGPRITIDEVPLPIPETEWKIRVPFGSEIRLLDPGSSEMEPAKGSVTREPSAELPGKEHRIRVPGGSVLRLEMIPTRTRDPLWHLGVCLGIFVVGGLLLWLLPRRAFPILAVSISSLAAFLLGPAAALLWIVPLGIAVVGMLSIWQQSQPELGLQDSAGMNA